ncbi:MAG: hypothetical protein AAGJ70_13205 [Pseudomonadota bacterium]
MTHSKTHRGAKGFALVAAAALVATSTAASAGKLERGYRNISPIFERGTYAEISGAFIFPSASGQDNAGRDFGNFYKRDTDFGGAFKIDWSDRLSSAYIVDEPYGANISYDGAPFPLGPGPVPGVSLNGTFATLSTIALTSITRYKFTPNWSIYGGTRSQRTSFEVGLPFVAPGYVAKAKADWGFGFLGGIAWENPAIKARASLTYHSEIEHEWTINERTAAGFLNAGRFKNQTPQGIDFDFRFPVAQTTLLYGNVHWADFSETSLSLPSVPTPILEYNGDNWAATLGVAQVMRPNWILAADVTYEWESGEDTSPFRTADGEFALGVSSRHQYQGANITVGAKYKFIEENDPNPAFIGQGLNFGNHDALIVGAKIGFNFVPQAGASLK